MHDKYVNCRTQIALNIHISLRNYKRSRVIYYQWCLSLNTSATFTGAMHYLVSFIIHRSRICSRVGLSSISVQSCTDASACICIIEFTILRSTTALSPVERVHTQFYRCTCQSLLFRPCRPSYCRYSGWPDSVEM